MKQQAASKTAKPKSGVAGLLVKVILVVLLVYAAVTLYHLQEQIQTARSQEAALAAQVQGLSDENDALRADIADAGKQEKLEDVARNDLGMVKSGEKVYYDTGY